MWSIHTRAKAAPRHRRVTPGNMIDAPYPPTRFDGCAMAIYQHEATQPFPSFAIGAVGDGPGSAPAWRTTSSTTAAPRWA